MRFMTTLCALTALVASAPTFGTAHDAMTKARARTHDLRYEVYATSGQVERLATDRTVLARAWDAIQKMGITKVYVEVHRGGHVVSNAHLVFVRDWLREKGIDVVGGIATVPGGDFGVRQKAPLQWFNWQNEKTQRDVRELVRAKAGIFATIIVDDFFCTGDLSEESVTAKGDRSWGEYRRDLLSELARSVIVGPAKEVNPAITVIVKYPQWYDRFHLFGYDTVTLPQIFDQVWVGTETRGRTTQRYGFVQPYEGFVNFRWLAGIAGSKIGGAWFDHGDCGPHDFLDQAYMSVLAGARELVFFNLGDLMDGHPDHARVVAEFDRLADLAAAVRANPITGVPAYKPPNSDPSGDMFLMDFLGMMGIPILPVHEFPETAPVIFLPAQAAADPHLVTRVEAARDRGARIIMTTSLLAVAPDGRQLARMAGLQQQVRSRPILAQLAIPASETCQPAKREVTVDLESPLEIDPGPGGISVAAGEKRYTLLAAAGRAGSQITLLNTHTFCQADFDAVGEVLLCPRPLGLLAIEGSPLRALRAAFRADTAALFEGPNCVAFQPFHGCAAGTCVIQNYNETPARVTLTLQLPAGQSASYVDAFAGSTVSCRVSESGTHAVIDLAVPARGRIWVRPAASIPEETAIPSSIDGAG